MATTLAANEPDDEMEEAGLGAQMSFLDHLDELRSRLIRCIAAVILFTIGCWFVSGSIYNFLAAPVYRELGAAQTRDLRLQGVSGSETIAPLSSLKEDGPPVRYVFGEQTKLGVCLIPPGATVMARLARDANGQLGLFTDESLVSGNNVLPKGVRLPYDPKAGGASGGPEGKLILTTMMEGFALYLKVSLYAAITLAVPFILWQIWAFISPGLYKHERLYVTPFVSLSSISFVLGAAFAYYILFPPAARYLLGLGSDFQLLLKADDYFDFIILVMLAMGVVFQMPAVTYVLSRIGIVDAAFLARNWKISLVVILIAAAVLSPTGDIPNLMLFALPMFVLYAVSIGIAWFFGRERKTI
jgi:sec-independent protein translocase protein TatC